VKHLSFRILFLCIFLPPVLYIFSIQTLEALIQKKWTADLEKRLISNSEILLEGRISIQDEIKQNIDRYLGRQYVLRLGVIPRIAVKTKTGRLLYPKISPEALYPFDSDTSQWLENLPGPLEAVQAAKENLKIMEEGIVVSIAVRISRNTWLANIVLVFYIFMSTFILYRAYRARTREAERLSLRNQQALESAHNELTTAQDRLQYIEDKEKAYQKKIEKVQAELAIAGNKVQTIEDEALEEMEALEEKLLENVALREKMEKEVTHLGQELERMESSRKTTSKKQDKQIKSSMKRFKTLYKNLKFHPRAVEGFLNLQGELQLRAEELIHNMNEDSGRLTVKRKVFSKKGSLPVLESEFAYRGRIYWKRNSDGKTQILAIGTKKTQTKDLAYLESL